MTLNKLLAGIALLAFVAVPVTIASADSDLKPSFANKKAGKVGFTKEEGDDIAVDVSDIEPAAGAEEGAEVEDAAAEDVTEEESSLAEDMKLPRK